jgi:DNA-binding IclR family transcriptional regulator
MKTIKKALSILDLFTENSPSLGLTEISSKAGIPKSTTHGLLLALKEKGFLYFDNNTRKYSLGFKILQLANRINYGRDIRDLCEPTMRKLSTVLGEDIALNALIGEKRVCISLIESLYFVRQFVPIGKALPLHASAAGKVLLAYLPEQIIEKILNQGLPAFTPKTITDKRLLRTQLQAIRRNGYGESVEEYGKDAASIAFPIFEKTGEVLFCISIQSTIVRLTSRTKSKYIRQGLEAVKKIQLLYEA